MNILRAVPWIGDINSENLKKTIEQITIRLKESPDEPVDLLITSAGGSISAGHAFYDGIKNLFKINLNTFGAGDVSSMAIIVFLAGKKRFITPHTLMYFHELGRTLEGQRRYDATEFESSSDAFKLMTQYYSDIVAKNSQGKLTATKVRKMLKENRVLNAKEIVSLGLAHSIST